MSDKSVQGAGPSSTVPTTYNGPYTRAPSTQQIAYGAFLWLGHEGPAVEEAQRLLNRLGASVDEDAHYGPECAQAVQSFQRAHELKDDGKLGSATWTALQVAAERARASLANPNVPPKSSVISAPAPQSPLQVPQPRPASQALASQSARAAATPQSNAPHHTDAPIAIRSPREVRTVEARIAARRTSDGRYSTTPRKDPRLSHADAAPRVSRVINGEALRPARDMSAAEAETELVRLGVTFEKVPASETTLGIANPVRVTFPILGVGFRYKTHAYNHRQPMDVRAAVALAHFAMWAKERGVVEIEHLGVHVVHQASQPQVLQTETRGRGLGWAVSALSLDRPPGDLVPGSSPARYRVDVLRHWQTARSSAKIDGGAGIVVGQTPEEIANMSPEEALLREAWGFFMGEMSYTVTPSTNPAHHNHLHVGLQGTAVQRAEQDRQFKRYLTAHPDARPNTGVQGYQPPS